ncbi:glycogen/starch synthase [Candidatus Woesearchaeota archaeon]|nr:glycogen/starch synthase [Candidatus Woesearchaeota archaeon]
MIRANADYVFEVSWEVCNKAGGINTVIKTKAPYMMEYYTNYFLIGPYFKDKAEVEVQQIEPPDFLRKIFFDLKTCGIKCYYGKWEVRGEPRVILVDFQSFFSEKDKIKTKLWEDYKVDSLSAPYDFDEPIVWSWCVGMLLEKIGHALPKMKIIAHFHEWLAGAGMLYLKSINSKIGTVFTTHATMLGRTLAGNGFDLYDQLGKFDPSQKAKEYNITSKHTMEVACANNTGVFTTVSEITSIEAEKLLGRKADVLVLNGIEIERFPTIEETSIKHVTCRNIIREFLTYHFFPYYTFELNKNLTFFIAGRYEFHNKGIDIFIKALGELNRRLKKNDTPRTVSVFFWVPMRTYGIKVELLENKNYYRHIKSLVDMKSNQIMQQIVNDFISRTLSVEESFFEKEFMREVKSNVLTFQRSGNPSVLTHNIENEAKDPVIQGLLAEGLDNKPDDKVKVIVYPVYLTGNDGLLDLPAYDAMAGCHFGIFPSYYESWGYTPLEAAAMGIASITSDLAGFGRFIHNKLLKEHAGIYVLKRFERTREQVVQDLADTMYKYANLDHAERVQNKINAKYISNLADWKHFIKFYIMAHNRALEK